MRLQVDVLMTSASAVRRFLPMQLVNGSGTPGRVLESFVLPRGSGEARAILRALGSSVYPSVNASTTCDQLSSRADPLSPLFGEADTGNGAGGARLQRHESVAVTASVWIARTDCPSLPVQSAVPLSPTLVFVSAYTDAQGARCVDLPADPSITLLSPFFSTDRVPEVVRSGVSASLCGVLARVGEVTWTVTGIASSDATALNVSAYGGSMPPVHTLSWTSPALSSALPPYSLLPGYWYSASASVTLSASWAWDAAAFETGAFPPAPPPPTAHVLPSAPETIVLPAELVWQNSLPPIPAGDALGRSAALAHVTVPPSAVSVFAQPGNGTALTTLFNLTAAGGSLPLNAEAADITPSTNSATVREREWVARLRLRRTFRSSKLSPRTR